MEANRKALLWSLALAGAIIAPAFEHRAYAPSGRVVGTFVCVIRDR